MEEQRPVAISCDSKFYINEVIEVEFPVSKYTYKTCAKCTGTGLVKMPFLGFESCVDCGRTGQVVVDEFTEMILKSAIVEKIEFRDDTYNAIYHVKFVKDKSETTPKTSLFVVGEFEDSPVFVAHDGKEQKYRGAELREEDDVLTIVRMIP